MCLVPAWIGRFSSDRGGPNQLQFNAWRGACATGTGFIGYIDDLRPNHGQISNNPTVAVLGFSLTIAGVFSGNGTFYFANSTRWILETGSGVDMTMELVGAVWIS